MADQTPAQKPVQKTTPLQTLAEDHIAQIDAEIRRQEIRRDNLVQEHRSTQQTIANLHNDRKNWQQSLAAEKAMIAALTGKAIAEDSASKPASVDAVVAAVEQQAGESKAERKTK